MAVRSRPLANLVLAVKGAHTSAFQCPAGRTAIARQWSLTVPGSGTAVVILGVRTAGSVLQVWRGQITAPGTEDRPDCNLVLGPLQELTLFLDNASTATSVHLYAGGSLLLGEPE